MFNSKNFDQLRSEIPSDISIVAVSKFHPASDIETAYSLGIRIFGESRPQELAAKYKILPKDIQWHMIGHLQTNKIKLIAPFVSLIHSIDSLHLAEAVNKEAQKINRKIPVLIQVHVAQENTKQGFSTSELLDLLDQGVMQRMKNIQINGIMAMASLTQNQNIIKQEFQNVKSTFDKIKTAYLPYISIVSMGMSEDYIQAIQCGANMIRIGSLLFGDRK